MKCENGWTRSAVAVAATDLPLDATRRGGRSCAAEPMAALAHDAPCASHAIEVCATGFLSGGRSAQVTARPTAEVSIGRRGLGSEAKKMLLGLAVLALAPAATGCSLMGLDEFPPARCTMDSQCADLEGIEPTGDACRTWQCNNPAGSDGICEIRSRDDDDDGSPAATCAMGMLPDCDDMDPMRSATTLEVCNLVDDDCDGVADPSFAGTGSTIATLGPSAGRVTFSRGYTGSEVSVARVPPAGSAARVEVGRLTPGSAGMLSLTPTMTDNVERGVGAHATLGDDGTMVVYDPVASATDCGRDTARPVQARWLRASGAIAATTCLEQTTLGAASLVPEPEGDTLLVWVDDDGARECGASATSAVRARILRHVGGASPRIAASDVLELGATGDALGPSATFVQGEGWVIAHVAEDARIEVHRIGVVADLVTASASPMSTIATTAAAEVSVSVGAGTTVAVAYTEGGCGAPNQVLLRTADVSAGSVVFGDAIPVTADAAAARRAPVAAYHAGRAGEWAVLYRERDDERAVRLDPAGEPIGMPTALGLGTVSGRPHVEALNPTAPAAPSWGFVAVTTAGEVRSGALSCVEPM